MLKCLKIKCQRIITKPNCKIKLKYKKQKFKRKKKEEKLMNLIAVYYTESGLENLRFR